MTFPSSRPNINLPENRANDRRAVREAEAALKAGVKRMKQESPSINGLGRTMDALHALEREGEGRVPVARRRYGSPLARVFNRHRLPLFSGIAVLSTVCLGAWWQNMNTLPMIDIPSSRPAHNAYLQYRQATNLLVNGNAVSEAMSDKPVRLPVKVTSGVPGVTAKTQEYKTYTQQEREALIAENAEALNRLRSAFATPYYNPPARSFSTLFPEFAKFREAARTFALESKTRAGKGDWSGAMESALDAMYLGNEVPRGGSLIADLVGIACQAIGRRQAWEILPHLNAQEARAAIHRLEVVEANQTSFSDVLTEEKYGMQAGLMEVFRGNNWRGGLVSSVYGTGDDNRQNNWAVVGMQLRLLVVSKRRIMENLTNALDAKAANARMPYSYRQSDEIAGLDPLSELLMPVFSQARFSHIVIRTQNALLRLSLALRVYQLEKGGYPDSLSELVSEGIVQSLPGDDFADGNAFHYANRGHVYTLYSVGPDGKDDGGRPILDTERLKNGNAQSARMVQSNSIGDIVAGVNGI